jgi:predicted metal-dependent phosphoesterase TrpH
MSQTARLDLHCHTLYSGDCFVPLDELVRLAAARGVTHLAITDHDSCECARRSDQETWPIKLIFGEEVTLADGTHLIALGIRTEIAGRSLAEALREMRAAGAFIIVPHPFKKASGIFARPGNELAAAQQLVAEFADAIEVCNSKLTDPENAQAFGLARQLHKLMTVGSDSHFGYDVGDAQLEVEAVSDASDWRALLTGSASRRVMQNRYVRQKGVDEHMTDTRVNNMLPGLRPLVPKPVRTLVKRTLHRAVYQPRVRRRSFALEEVRF